jgi:hypothetical protein
MVRGGLGRVVRRIEGTRVRGDRVGPFLVFVAAQMDAVDSAAVGRSRSRLVVDLQGGDLQGPRRHQQRDPLLERDGKQVIDETEKVHVGVQQVEGVDQQR